MMFTDCRNKGKRRKSTSEEEDLEGEEMVAKGRKKKKARVYKKVPQISLPPGFGGPSGT